MRQSFGLKLREELHAHALVKRPGELARIKISDRLTIMRAYADTLASMQDLRLVNIVVDKFEKPDNYDVFDSAWMALIQRFENTLRHENFPGPQHSGERGMIFPDRTDDKKLGQLLRKMHHYNPVPNLGNMGYRNLVLAKIVESHNFRDSAYSYFIQSTDLAAYLLQQKLNPCKVMRRKSGQNYFDRLDPILCKVASREHPQGIVLL